MNKTTDGYASRSEEWEEHETNLYLDLCFDLTLSATEAIRIFDDRSKLRSSQNQVSSVETPHEKSTHKLPCAEN